MFIQNLWPFVPEQWRFAMAAPGMELCTVRHCKQEGQVYLQRSLPEPGRGYGWHGGFTGRRVCTWASSDPESHPKVGFESVSGFGFRVSSIETNFRCLFRVSGFGFRRLKPTFAVGFGFRVSSIETHFRCRFRVSGFGFCSSKPTINSRFRVSGFDRPWGS